MESREKITPHDAVRAQRRVRGEQNEQQRDREQQRRDRRRAVVAAAEGSMRAHLDALATERDQAMQTFTDAAAAIGEAQARYRALWTVASRDSMRCSTNDANAPALGHPLLEPHTSRLNPRHLSAALGRVLSAAGVNVTSTAMRRGRGQHRAARGRR